MTGTDLIDVKDTRCQHRGEPESAAPQYGDGEQSKDPVTKRTRNRVKTAGHALAVTAVMASANALGAEPESRMLKRNGETIALDRAAEGSIKGASGTLKLHRLHRLHRPHISAHEARGAIHPAAYVVVLLDEARATDMGTQIGDVGRIWDAACGPSHDHVERLSRPDAGERVERLEQADEEATENGGKP